MTSMLAPQYAPTSMPHHKACEPCASSKRKCDRQLPVCERCMKRDVECVYPQRKKQKRSVVVEHDQIANQLSTSLPYSVDFEITETLDWNWDIAVDSDLTVPPDLNDHRGIELTSLDSTPTLLDWPIHEASQDIARPWYLQKDTWQLQHHAKDPECALEVNYDPYIVEVRSMLRSWSTTGHNEFVHRKLYERRMPHCIQEAFTMLSAYFNCSAGMRSTVLQIAEDQSCRLIQHETLETNRNQSTLDHLARVHALFACVFVRLFDDSIRHRASAEKQMSVLRSWVSEMLQQASQIDGINTRIHSDLNPKGQRIFDTELESMLEQWNTWLVAESVRRTHIIVNTILNVYLCLSVGGAECSGFIMLTARKGLWQAESATRWSKIVSSESPLLISIMNPKHFLSDYPASEFDEMVKLLWKYMVGQEEIQRWIERDTGVNL